MTETFTLNNIEYQADKLIDDVLINPLLPDNFWTATVSTRSTGDAAKWFGKPFVKDLDKILAVYCLDGRCYDGPSVWSYFTTLDKAIQCCLDGGTFHWCPFLDEPTS
jgi:hypothetical protein